MTMRREFGSAVREQALQRAVYRCERCGVRQPLEFHHRGHPADRSLFNCEVLCTPCHRAETNKRKLSRRRAGRGA
jgi:5-methylcytosine-specific restriction endonuclease McrA